MFKKISFVLFLFSTFLLTTFSVSAEETDFLRGRVVNVEEAESEVPGIEATYQRVEVEIDSTNIVKVEHGRNAVLSESEKLNVGDRVILQEVEGENNYIVYDKYRMNWLYALAGLFILSVLVINGFKGFGSLLGLSVSIFVLIQYVVPQILAGGNPLLISIFGSAIIMTVTLFLAHGFNKQTFIALISTVLTFSIVGILAYFSVELINLSGLGSEEAVLLSLSSNINFRGLLLGGIIIGALGVLDDITISQTAIVAELIKANKSFDIFEVIRRALNVGKEHISSLVNTLVLAYAGASLPIFVYLVRAFENQPFWVILNEEFLVEEIVRTLVGSIGLILAVPITTVLAAFMFFYVSKPDEDNRGHLH